jgi:hypothetical protein
LNAERAKKEARAGSAAGRQRGRRGAGGRKRKDPEAEGLFS